MKEIHLKFFMTKRNENSLTHFKPIPSENIKKPELYRHELMYVMYLTNLFLGFSKIIQGLKYKDNGFFILNILSI